MQTSDALDSRLRQALESNFVSLTNPRPGMYRLKAVPLDNQFSKPRTNLLIRMHDRGGRAFVDEDLRYLGDDRALQEMLQGETRRGWRQIHTAQPLDGGLNDILCQTLRLLGSPLELPSSVSPRRTHVGLAEAFSPFGYQLDVDSLAAGLQPLEEQLEAIAQADAVCNGECAPRGVVFTGPSGVGKTTVARLAAKAALDRGCVDHVIQIEASWLSGGVLVLSERDERTRRALELAASLPRVLVIVEQIDLLLAHSRVAEALVAGALDRGLKLLATVSPWWDTGQIDSDSLLARRLLLLALHPPTFADMANLLQHRVAAFPGLHVAREAIAAVLTLAEKRPGVNPAAALGLLENVVRLAERAGIRVVGPDDVLHLMRQS